MAQMMTRGHFINSLLGAVLSSSPHSAGQTLARSLTLARPAPQLNSNVVLIGFPPSGKLTGEVLHQICPTCIKIRALSRIDLEVIEFSGPEFWPNFKPTQNQLMQFSP